MELSAQVHEGNPQSYFAASLGASLGDEASGLELYRRLPQTYSSFWKRPDLTKAEKSLSGTYWDEYVCMTLGQLARFDGSAGHNRWGADPRHLTVVALWVHLNAISTDSLIELM